MGVGGGGVAMAKHFQKMYKAELEFSGGWGFTGNRKNLFHRGGVGGGGG